LLITPVRQKKYDMYASAIGSLWKQAAENLQTADRIVIVGYSFPATDVRALGLLRTALSKRRGDIKLEVVAPGVKEILGRIGDNTLSMAKTVTSFDMKFERYLEQLRSHIPAMMREAAAQSKEVQDWLKTLLGLSIATAEQRQALHRAGRRHK
jgi:hypothetical protein